MSETKYCQNCGKLIDKNCIVCSWCGKQVEFQKKKKRGSCLGTILLVLGALIFFFAFIGMVGGEKEETQKEVESSQTEKEEEKQSAPIQRDEESYEITYQNLTVSESILGGVVYDAIVEIENTGTVDLYLKDAVFDIENSSGSIVASENFISADPSIIAPGEKGYFYNNMGTQNDTMNLNENYKLVPTIKAEKSEHDLIRYEISDTSIADSSFGITVVGRITNNTEEDESLVWISIILFNENDEPIIAYGTNITDLSAGSTVGFEASGVSLYDKVSFDDVARYEVYSSPVQYQF